MLSYPFAMHALSTQREIVCGPAPSQGGRYCVYHRSTPGLLGDSYSLLVGVSPNRGLRYEVPYARSQVAASWASDTGALTVSMPGTQLVIHRNEYVDTR